MNPTEEVAQELLESTMLSTEVFPAIDVPRRLFTTKREAAVFLTKLLADIPKQTLIEDQGLWTWLSVYFFDSICPRKGGLVKVRNDYTYIYEAKNMRHFYRHLLFISWRILDISPRYNRLFLDRSVSSLDRLTEEVMKKLYLTRIPCLFEVIDRIYWDPNTNRPRRGVTDSVRVTEGDLTHRFPTKIRQLEKTYDLQSLDADQLLELLGDEFDFNGTRRVQRELTFE